MAHNSSYTEQFRSAGALPSGPISPWPKGRKIRSIESFETGVPDNINSKEVKKGPTLGSMAKGLVKTAGSAVRNGAVSTEIRTERLETCFTCSHYKEKSGRCGLCGCFMKAKTWVGGNPDQLCPAKKWVR